MNRSQKSKINTQSAFTIVELLVVIVIIGILATIVVVFYIGTHDKAIDGSLQADLKGASTILELDKANGDLYPTTKESANGGKGLKSSDGTTLDYAYSSGDNSYCLAATKEGRSYYINSEGRVPVQGGCPVGNVVGSYINAWGSVNDDVGYSMISTKDGGYIMTGQLMFKDALLSKYKNDGSLEWSKTWGGAKDDWGTSIIQANDGGYVITGVAEGLGTGGDYDYDMFISKYDISGNLLWTKIWGNNVNAMDYGWSIIQTVDNGYAIVGYTNSFSLAHDKDAFIAKYSTNGDLEWSKTWGGAKDDSAKSLLQLTDGSFMVTGSTSSYGSGGSDSYGNSYSDVFLTKLNTNGDLIWSKTWGGANGNDYGNSLIETSDHGFAIGGGTSSYGVGGADQYGWAYSDALLLKYSINGDLEWSKTWGGTNNESIKSIIQATDGSIVASGDTESFGAGKLDSMLLKYNNDGNIDWAKTFGSNNVDTSYSLIQSNDKGYILSGQSTSYGIGGYDLFFAKYKNDGSITGCNTLNCKTTLGTVAAPTGIITSPEFTVQNQNASTVSSNIVASNINFTPTTIVKELTIYFSNKELHVDYPGENKTSCKEWNVPIGKKIKGFQTSQETESNYDYFTVSLDGVEKYKQSGIKTNMYTDTSSAPGSTIKACTSADGSVQSGFGGEVTGVVYN